MSKMNDTRWFKVVNNDSGRSSYESKFLTNDVLITSEDIEKEWPLWNNHERHEFISAYSQKRILNEEDFEIFEFLMEHAHISYQFILYDNLKELPDKRRTLNLLKKLINDVKFDEYNNVSQSQTMFYRSIIGPLHFLYDTLGLLGDLDAIPFIKEKVAAMMRHQEFYKSGDLSNGIVFICIKALEALCRLEPSNEYAKLLEGFHNHPDYSNSSYAREVFSSLFGKTSTDDTKGSSEIR
jgi:hypothetical protein